MEQQEAERAAALKQQQDVMSAQRLEPERGRIGDVKRDAATTVNNGGQSAVVTG